MKRIGLLSDTHAWWDDRYIRYFESCDEIWHAGDIGSLEVARRLEAIKPLRAVYGNIDGQELRTIYPKNQRFTIEGADVWITPYRRLSGQVRHGRRAGDFQESTGSFCLRTFAYS